MGGTTARRALAIAWPVALVYWIFERAGHLGFNILDDGLVAAYSDRILHGQVPHRDFITPRLAGTPILHIVDFALPLPLYLSERLVGTAEVVAFSVLLAWLIFDAPPWRWGPAQAFGAAASALVNLHTFPLESWYTFDGLLLVSAGFLLVRSAVRCDRPGRAAAGVVLCGSALLAKQSFFLAPAMAIAYLVYAHRRLPRRRLAARAAVWIALAAAPVAIYVAAITAFGGLDELIAQMTHGSAVWGGPLFEAVERTVQGEPAYTANFPWQVGVLAVALALLRVPRTPPPLGRAREPLQLVLAVAMAYFVLRLTFSLNLRYVGPWSLLLTWGLILVIAAQLVICREVDWTAVTVLALGWMSMLSWGYPFPGLTAGAMALVLVVTAFRDVRLERFAHAGQLAVVIPVAAAGVFLFTATQFAHARASYPYRDLPEPQLTKTLGDVSPELRGLRASPIMAAYARSLVACIKRYPARWTAVLPDNPGLYPALKLRNPFPADWFYFTDTYAGSRDQILSATRRLQREGDYLVLFQTVSGMAMQSIQRLDPATPRTQPVLAGRTYDPALAAELFQTLGGQRIVCGSFRGIWAPAST